MMGIFLWNLSYFKGEELVTWEITCLFYFILPSIAKEVDVRFLQAIEKQTALGLELAVWEDVEPFWSAIGYHVMKPNWGEWVHWEEWPYVRSPLWISGVNPTNLDCWYATVDHAILGN